MRKLLVLLLLPIAALAQTTCNTTPGTQKCAVGNLCVILGWKPPTGGGVYLGYNLFRGTTSGGESLTPINANLITGTSYEDDNVSFGNSYYYFAEAEETGGYLSVTSSEACAQTPVAPSPPVSLTATPAS